MLLDASGGHAANGSMGGRGRNGNSSNLNGGNGGDGGDGGNGGNGANIDIYVSDSDSELLWLLRTNVLGGSKGTGGSGGSGGSAGSKSVPNGVDSEGRPKFRTVTGRSGSPGSSGNDGDNGINGKYKIHSQNGNSQTYQRMFELYIKENLKYSESFDDQVWEPGETITLESMVITNPEQMPTPAKPVEVSLFTAGQIKPKNPSPSSALVSQPIGTLPASFKGSQQLTINQQFLISDSSTTEEFFGTAAIAPLVSTDRLDALVPTFLVREVSYPIYVQEVLPKDDTIEDSRFNALVQSTGAVKRFRLTNISSLLYGPNSLHGRKVKVAITRITSGADIIDRNMINKFFVKVGKDGDQIDFLAKSVNDKIELDIPNIASGKSLEITIEVDVDPEVELFKIFSFDFDVFLSPFEGGEPSVSIYSNNEELQHSMDPQLNMYHSFSIYHHYIFCAIGKNKERVRHIGGLNIFTREGEAEVFINFRTSRWIAPYNRSNLYETNINDMTQQGFLPILSGERVPTRDEVERIFNRYITNKSDVDDKWFVSKCEYRADMDLKNNDGLMSYLKKYFTTFEAYPGLGRQTKFFHYYLNSKSRKQDLPSVNPDFEGQEGRHGGDF